MDSTQKYKDSSHFSSNERGLFWFVFLLLCIAVFFPLLKIGFTTSDDLNTALMAWNPEQYLGHPIKLAKDQGRLVHVFKTYLDWVPYLPGSSIFYHISRLAGIVVNILFFAFIVRLFFRSTSLAVLTAVLSVSFVQNSWHHSLLTAYPFVFQFAFFLFLCSLYCFYQASVTTRKGWAVACGLFFLASMLIYEMFVTYLVLFSVVAFYLSQEKKKGLKLLLPVVISGAFFLVAYAIFKFHYPGNYSGSRIGELSISSIVRVIAQLSAGTFPGIFYLTDYATINATFDGFRDHAVGFVPFIQHLKPEWMIKGLITAVFCGYVLQKTRQANRPLFRLTWAAGSGILFMILPFFLLAVTPKYQQWINFGTLAYLPSFFSFLGTILILSSLCLYFYPSRSKKIFRQVYTFVICMVLFLGSAVTDYYNFYVNTDQELLRLRWTAVDRFLATDQFKNLAPGSRIYAPSLWEKKGTLIPPSGYWDKYFKTKGRTDISVYQAIPKQYSESRVAGADSYYLKFLQDPKSKSQLIVFGQIDSVEVLGTDHATLYSLSPYRSYVVIGKLINTDGMKPDIMVNGEMLLPQQANGSFFSCQVDFPFRHKGFSRSDLEGKSFSALVKATLSKIFRLDSPRQHNQPDDFYYTRIQSSVPLHMDSLQVSFFVSGSSTL